MPVCVQAIGYGTQDRLLPVPQSKAPTDQAVSAAFSPCGYGGCVACLSARLRSLYARASVGVVRLLRALSLCSCFFSFFFPYIERMCYVLYRALCGANQAVLLLLVVATVYGVVVTARAAAS